MNDIEAQIDELRAEIEFLKLGRASMMGMDIKAYCNRTGHPVRRVRHWIHSKWTEGVEYSHEGRNIVIHPMAVERRRKWLELV